MSSIIILTDTFNCRTISRHRTVRAAVKARRRHLRAVRRFNGANSYLTYSIRAGDGSDISDEVCAETCDLDCR